MRNLQEQVKKAFCFKNWSDLSLFRINCSSYLYSRLNQKFFSINGTIFSHSKSEQFWKQNTIVMCFYPLLNLPMVKLPSSKALT